MSNAQLNSVEATDEFQARVDAFAGQALSIINGGALALMVSVGHRTRLFDAMDALTRANSAAIAKAADLNERYVREWLGAMVTGGIVEYDATLGTYRLPPEHAASLTRVAGPHNLASFAQFVSLLGNVEDGIVERFRTGGGLPYSEFPKFQQLMAEDSAQVFDAALIDATLPLVPGLPERLRAGIDVADVGCGSGHAINLMAATYPSSRFIGFDFSEEGVATGRAEAKAKGLTNSSFELKDAAALGMADSFDLITAFDAVHDQAQPARMLAGIAAALRLDGVFLCVDIAASSYVHENSDHPLGPFLYTVSCMHCMTVSLAYDGQGLGAMWGEQMATQMLNDAGFGNVEVKKVEGDILNNYYVASRT
ncbi:MAG: class I SAM-dependent methyltransferase [Acidimicrobiales bacterium]